MNMLDAIKNGTHSHGEEIANAQAYRLRAIAEHDALIQLVAEALAGHRPEINELSSETFQAIHRALDAIVESERVGKPYVDSAA